MEVQNCTLVMDKIHVAEGIIQQLLANGERDQFALPFKINNFQFCSTSQQVTHAAHGRDRVETQIPFTQQNSQHLCS